MQNPFHNPAFSMANLTAAINQIPNRYGKLEALRLMTDDAGDNGDDDFSPVELNVGEMVPA